MPEKSRYRRCRYCPALVFWAETPAGNHMPIDVERTAEGNVEIVWRKVYDEPLARVLGPREIERKRAEVQIAHEQGVSDEPELLLHTSHFATCPKAKQARRGKRIAA